MTDPLSLEIARLLSELADWLEYNARYGLSLHRKLGFDFKSSDAEVVAKVRQAVALIRKELKND